MWSVLRPCSVPLLPGGYCINSIYKGPGPGLPACSCMTFFPSIFRSFLLSHFYRFFIDFGANLDPSWPPKSTKNPLKIDQKSNNFSDAFFSWFLNQIWWIFDRFLDPKLIRNRSKNHLASNSTTQQLKNKNVKKPLVFTMFRGPRHVLSWSKINKKLIKNPFQILPKIKHPFDHFFDRF